jgi:hypothetical protein
MRQRDAKMFGYEDVVSAQYGWEGLERMAPLRSLLEAGIPFHIEGTDPKNKPLSIVKDAVTRIDRKGRVVAPQEALTREQAILAITRWGARFISADNIFGSIEAGKWADPPGIDAGRRRGRLRGQTVRLLQVNSTSGHAPTRKKRLGAFFYVACLRKNRLIIPSPTSSRMAVNGAFIVRVGITAGVAVLPAMGPLTGWAFASGRLVVYLPVAGST